MSSAHDAITAAPSSLDCGQLLTICDIVWHLPQEQVGCCKATLLSTGTAVSLVGPEVIKECSSSVWVRQILVAG